jgi:hypothetical protein
MPASQLASALRIARRGVVAGVVAVLTAGLAQVNERPVAADDPEDVTLGATKGSSGTTGIDAATSAGPGFRVRQRGPGVDGSDSSGGSLSGAPTLSSTFGGRGMIRRGGNNPTVTDPLSASVAGDGVRGLGGDATSGFGGTGVFGRGGRRVPAGGVGTGSRGTDVIGVGGGTAPRPGEEW